MSFTNITGTRSRFFVSMSRSDRHTIRLWGPWQVQLCLPRSESPQLETRLNFRGPEPKAPAWDPESATEFEGSLVLSRRFNCPTGLDPGQQVLLEIQALPLPTPLTVQLNRVVKLGELKSGVNQEWELDLHDGGNLIELSAEVSPGELVSFPLPPFSRVNLHLVG